jgi:hypothetical protein
MENTKEIKVINVQLMAVLVTILSISISLVLTYNEKLEFENKDVLFDSKKTLDLALFNRILILSLGIVFLYVNYSFYVIAKDKDKDLKTYVYQIVGSILAISSALVTLYDITKTKIQTVADIENPIT